MAIRCCPPVAKATDPARRSTRALTARERAIYQAFLDAAAQLQTGVDSATTRRLIAQGIEAAMGSIDTGGFVAALGPMVDAIQAEVGAGGTAAMSELTRLTGVSGVLRFDVLDPRALAWAETQAGRLIRQVTDEQRAILRRILARSVENGWTVAQTTQDLRQVVGLHDRWATAVLNAKDRELERLIKTGMSEDLARQRADTFADRYRQRLVQARAKNIARTEILTASNQGRYLSWAQGVEQGYIAPNATKEWSTGPLVTRTPNRIQVCEVCQAVRGEQQSWDTEFSVGVMMPPAHPSCRCTAVLVPTSIEEIRRRLREADGQPSAPVDAPQPGIPSSPAPTAPAVSLPPPNAKPKKPNQHPNVKNDTYDFSGKDARRAQEVLDESFEDWRKSLTADEIAALRSYTGSGYTQMNKTLRAGKAETDKIRAAREALERAEMPADVIVQRGIFTTDRKITMLRKGDVFHDAAFQSTSGNVGFLGNVNMRILVPKGSKGAYLGKGKHSLKGYKEHEVLLPPGGTYRVVGRSVVDGENTIDVVLVSQGNPPPSRLIR